ncbi:MAG: hypothetical protein HY320_13970, partial [Armatimonadetes bacterium]|nr:hypothetical protein [Armatimonadota bacterium]
MASSGEHNWVRCGGVLPEPGASRLWPWVYNAALIGLAPAIAGYLTFRLVIKGKSRVGLSQRLGRA